MLYIVLKKQNVTVIVKPIMTIPLVLVCVSEAFCNRYVYYYYVIPFVEK